MPLRLKNSPCPAGMGSSCRLGLLTTSEAVELGGLSGQTGEFGHVSGIGEELLHSPGIVSHCLQAALASPVAAAKDLGELSDHCRQLEARGGFIKGDRQIAAMELLVDLGDFVEPDILVPHVDGSQGPLRTLTELLFIKSSNAVSGTDLARIHRVVAEVLVGLVAVFVTQQPVAVDGLRVEIDLHLGVLGDNLERSGEVFNKDALGLGERIDIVVGAITVVGELLHQNVVVVAHSETNRGQGDTLVDVLPDLVEDRFGSGVADAVGQDHNAGDAVRLDLVGGQLVGDLQIVFDVGGAA